MKQLLILFLFVSLSFAQITTVVSNRGGSGGGGEPPAGYTLDEDFSSDNSADWTGIKDGLTWDTGNGIVYGSNDWATNWSYYETAMGSDDHWIEAKVRSAGSYRAGVVFRSNGTTGYIVYLSSTNSRIYLFTFNGTTATEVTNYTASGATMTDDQETWMKVTITGTSIDVDVDINGDGDYDDTGEGMTTWTNSTYSTGQYVGLYVAMDAAQPPYITEVRADAD